MAQLPIRNAIATYSSQRGADTEARLKAIEDHLAQMSAQINRRSDDSRFYYNDSVTSYEDDMPDDPPIDEFVAWGINDGVLWVAANGAWTGIGQLNYSTVTKTGAYTTGTWDGLILCDASGGAFTVTLSTNAGAYGAGGKEYVVKKIDGSANAVTIAGASGNIDGAASKTLTAQYDSLWVRWDGSNWHILAKNP